MRRSETADFNLTGVDLKISILNVQIKGGYTHPYRISRKGLEAIEKYIE